MATIASTFSRDGNRVPITSHGLTVSKELAYDGTIGATGADTLFTVTGTVALRIFAVCSEDLAGATATIEVGISGNTAALIAQTTATDIDSGEVWKDNAPAAVEGLPSEFILTGGTDIIETIATAAITDGTLTYYCLWVPISDDGNVVAA